MRIATTKPKWPYLYRHLSTFVELELAFEASIVSLRLFGNGIWIEEQSIDTNLQKGTKRAERRKKREHCDHQEEIKLVRERSRRRIAKWFRDAVLDRPKLQTWRNAEGQGKKAMELTIGWIVKLISEPDLLRRMMELNGLKTLILNETSSAYCIHCFDHQLQLTFVALANKDSNVNGFFLVTTVLNIVRASFKRRNLLRKHEAEKTLDDLIVRSSSVIHVFEFTECECSNYIDRLVAKSLLMWKVLMMTTESSSSL
ncbi:hypothetical protein H5410_015060 [Solanum commersonii]|uniref:Uncharacterized protein n=1 Tax=Solanum commersonii TaxID=4109 RepID=A0A9J5ZT99_SOLCO|nr:hypothetical protein H5410_015060 [Solanum commersonii]